MRLLNCVGHPVNFRLGVFLSHNSKDKPIVHPLAGGLRRGGLRARLDEWGIKSGYTIPAKPEEELHHLRVPALWMSTNVFGSDRAQLESGTVRFHDLPHNEHRFTFLRCP